MLDYYIESGDLVVRESSSGEQLWRGRVCAQTGLKCSAIPDSGDAIVLVEAGTKERPFFENLLRVQSNGEIVWAASTLGSHDSFVNFLLCGDEVVATTWNGSRVGISIESGKIVSEHFVK